MTTRNHPSDSHADHQDAADGAAINEQLSQLFAQELALMEKQLPASYEPLNRLKAGLMELRSQASALVLDEAPMKSAAQASMLAGFLEEAKNVRALSLHGVKVSAQALAQLAEHPEAFANIETFAIKDHGLTKKHIVELGKLLSAMPKLQKIAIENCNASGKDLAPVYSALASCKSLSNVTLTS